jgi:hypothetical protein
MAVRAGLVPENLAELLVSLMKKWIPPIGMMEQWTAFSFAGIQHSSSGTMG